ncbi:hypothetical protein CIB95_14320 [Lottiidibacillus patelloidae]|uniref:Uncharacterized protein n=1 Tax=Lottiidibacillus patelloidae TaxID=2670334 RepID=A0A263BQM6_9BACI|nr:hypothetical protein [Lottiidibacillus patelloidae]OZM56014.1 hypothetical protein CIB95_14320 [Lottiidibacillus patelloidae]
MITARSNFKRKNALLYSIVVIFLLSIFFFVSSLFVAKEKSLATIEEAFLNNDVEVLQKLLTSTDSELEMSRMNIEMFLGYLERYKIEEKTLLEAIREGKEHHLLAITTKKKWYFFEEYVFAIKPFYIEMAIDPHIQEIEIVGIENLIPNGADKVRSSPLMPGAHQLYVTHVTEYGPVYKSKLSIPVFRTTANQHHIVKQEVKTRYIEFQAYDAYGGTLLINGKPTNIIVDTNDRVKKIYGIPTDGTYAISVKKKFPWGEYTSAEVKILSNIERVRLNPLNEEMVQEIHSVMVEFGESWQVAFNNNDPTRLKHVTPKMREHLGGRIKEFYSYGVTRLEEINVWNLSVSERELITLSKEEVEEKKDLLLKQKEYYHTSGFTSERYNIDRYHPVFQYYLHYDMQDGKWYVYDEVREYDLYN